MDATVAALDVRHGNANVSRSIQDNAAAATHGAAAQG
jgi:hypothetical protein